jgi:hypothetical protein
MPKAQSRLVIDVYGFPADGKGKGFYVSLELMAILWGVNQQDPGALLDPDVERVTYVQRSHDFARRLATSGHIDESALEKAVDCAETAETLSELFGSLIVGVPGRRATPTWFGAHLYPFVGELVHYDAAERRGRPKIERYLYRDGGGWAYRALRLDHDCARRQATAEGLRQLVMETNTSLGRLAKSLAAHDEAPEKIPFVDESEAETNLFEDSSPWPEMLRRGVHNIVERTQVAQSKRIEQLMHWVPYVLARHVLHLARDRLNLSEAIIPIDAMNETNPLRQRSAGLLENYRWDIINALRDHAVQLHEIAKQESGYHASTWEPLVTPRPSFTAGPASFFSETLASVGALNSVYGRRHFTFKAPMVEAICAATIRPREELEYPAFLERLCTELRVAVDDKAAQSASLTEAVDVGVFRENQKRFREQLSSVGHLTRYSEGTVLVHGEAR